MKKKIGRCCPYLVPLVLVWRDPTFNSFFTCLGMSTCMLLDLIHIQKNHKLYSPDDILHPTHFGFICIIKGKRPLHKTQFAGCGNCMRRDAEMKRKETKVVICLRNLMSQVCACSIEHVSVFYVLAGGCVLNTTLGIILPQLSFDF